MRITFESQRDKDSKLLEITITDNDKQHYYAMEIIGNTERDTKDFSKHLRVMKTHYATSTSFKPQYKVSYDEVNHVTVVEGNLADALKCMLEMKEISQDLYNKIYADPQVKPFIEQSTTFKLPQKPRLPDSVLFANYKNKIQRQETASTDVTEAIQSRNQLTTVYDKLPTEVLKEELKALKGWIAQISQQRGINEEEITYSHNDTPKSQELKAK